MAILKEYYKPTTVQEALALLERPDVMLRALAGGTHLVGALETRLARIPDERRMETQAIEARYAKLDDRTFPVAVIFVVPESAGGAA